MADNLSTAKPWKPRRRWYQFRLRTLLIVVVVVAIPCAYVAREAKIVAERRAWLEAHGSTQPYDPSDGYLPPPVVQGDSNKSPSMIRIWLGDEPHSIILIGHSTAVEQAAAAALFPEADIRGW
jgi:hypothetical protein